MRKLMFFPLALVIMAVMFAFTNENADNNKNNNSGPSANGQGQVIPIGFTEPQQFSFHANTNKNGVVSGSWQSNSPAQNVITHGAITCMTILPDGKTAVLSGVVTNVNEDNPYGITVGTQVWFKVQDGGEGSNADPDQFTDYYFFLSGCLDYGGAIRPTLNGNIQVKP